MVRVRNHKILEKKEREKNQTRKEGLEVTPSLPTKRWHGYGKSSIPGGQ
jgi:hypothetical protein